MKLISVLDKEKFTRVSLGLYFYGFFLGCAGVLFLFDFFVEALFSMDLSIVFLIFGVYHLKKSMRVQK